MPEDPFTFKGGPAHLDPFRYEAEHKDEVLWCVEMGVPSVRPVPELRLVESPLVGSEEAA